MEEESHNAGMVVAIRIKPPDLEEEFSVTSQGANMLTINVSDNRATYKYDFVHWSTGLKCDTPRYASQEAVFNDVGAPLVQNALQGFNCCLFAYGQTGSGKTYTMLGDSENEGVIPRVCRSIMQKPSHEDGSVTTFTITYVEIFLERVRDLLRPPPAGWDTSKQSLKVREHPSDGPFVEGATAADVVTYEECMAMMEMGSKNRQVASTKMNQQSSRSHAIFTLQVTQSKPLDGEAEEDEMYTVVSKINLVDLAGSENAATAGSTGDRLKEGAAINKSLLSLGRVIKALADNASALSASNAAPSTPLAGSGTSTSTTKSARRVSMFEQSTGSRATPVRKQRESYGGEGSSRLGVSAAVSTPSQPRERAQVMIPYRDSVLTYLLKESLGGNSKTTMIAAIRPGATYAEETASTLRYAAQAKKIVNIVTVNENPYVKMIKKLQADVEALTKLLQASTAAAEAPLSTLVPLADSESDKVVIRRRRVVRTNHSEVDDKEASDSEDIFTTGPTSISDVNMILPGHKQMRDSATAMTPASNSTSIEQKSESVLGNDEEYEGDALADALDDDEVGTPTVPSNPSTPSVPSAQDVALLQQKLNMVRRSSLRVAESYEKYSPIKKPHSQRPSASRSRPSSAGSQSSFLADGGDSMESDGKRDIQRALDGATPTTLLGDMDSAVAVEDSGPRQDVCGDKSGNAADREETGPHSITSPSGGIQGQEGSPGVEASPVVVLYSRGRAPTNRTDVSGHVDKQARDDSPEALKSTVTTDRNDKSDLPALVNHFTVGADSNSREETLSAPNSPSRPVDPASPGRSTFDGGSVYFDTNELNTHPVLKEGFLMKRGYVNTALQRRWCVLRGKTIYYYRQYRDKNVRGTINCDGATVEVAVKKAESVPFSFYLHTPKDREHTKWFLQAASEDELTSWVNAIEIAALHCDKTEQQATSNCTIS